MELFLVRFENEHTDCMLHILLQLGQKLPHVECAVLSSEWCSHDIRFWLQVP